MAYELDSAWYATTKRARSRTKVIVYDDVGKLIVDRGSLTFQGSDLSLGPIAPTSVTLTRQRVNSVVYLAAGVMMFPVYGAFAYLGHLLFSLPFWGFVALLYCALPLGLAVGLSTRWVRVSFCAETGELEEAWFADGGKHGWTGILGGTGRLFMEITAGNEREGTEPQPPK